MKIEKFKVLLYLKKSGMDKNGKAPIMGRITVNRTMAQFSCKLSCTPSLSLVISIWGNFTQWREYQDWGEADLKYRALKMVLPSDDPNVRYIEKFFSVCRDEKVIDDVKNRVAAYEDSVYHHYKMVKMAAIKDSIANSLFKEANEIKKKINKK